MSFVTDTVSSTTVRLAQRIGVVRLKRFCAYVKVERDRFSLDDDDRWQTSNISRRSFAVDILRLFMAPSPARTVGPAIASMLIYLLMAVVLYLRPSGLFPARGR